jgi:hypothetical protein
MRRGAQVTVKRQDGIALLVFVIVLAFAAITYALNSVSIEQLRYEQTMTTQSALARAKQALIDYAVTYQDSKPGQYGFLPCPDHRVSGTEGGSDGNCGPARENIMGLFPWASMETGILRSGTGQCLWYAVSGEYKSSPQTAMLNEDTNGAMRLYDADGVNIKQGADAEDRVVAIIFNPSNVLPGQSRNFDDTSLCGKDYNPMEYLEGNGTISNSPLSGGELAIDDFIKSGVVDDVATGELETPFNDQLVTISRKELWDAVLKRRDFEENMRRMTEALAWCIADYGNNSGNRKLPRPAPVDFNKLDYRDDANYNDTAAVSYMGRYPYNVEQSDIDLGTNTTSGDPNAPNKAEPVLFKKGFCDALVVAGGAVIDLDPTPQSPPTPEKPPEGYTTWKNWKDHFFYAVSSSYAPSSVEDTPGANCDGSNCIVVGGNEYAAVVLFAGSRTDDQVRNEPVAGDDDTKKILGHYLEVADPDDNGTGDYTPTGAIGATSRDIAYCITDADTLKVESCP